MPQAADLLNAAAKQLRAARPDILRATKAGDFRRGMELAGDMSLVPKYLYFQVVPRPSRRAGN